jgi:hypothetical protein
MNTNYIMENTELILTLLQKYRPDHAYETVTNEQGVVELILPTDKEPLPLPLDASAKWSDVKKVFDFYEIYIAKTAKPIIKPSEPKPNVPIDIATIEALMAAEAEAASKAAEASANVTDAEAEAASKAAEAEAASKAAEAEAASKAAEASANVTDAEASANVTDAEASAAI